MSMPNTSFSLYNDDLSQCYNVSHPLFGTIGEGDENFWACTLNVAGANTFLTGSGASILANTSKDGEAKTHIDRNGTNFAYLGVPTRSDLYNVDFSARTWGLSSTCTPITKECVTQMHTNGAEVHYDCSSIAFGGDITTSLVNQMNMQYYSGADMRQEAQWNVSVGNPYYYAAIASVNQNTGFEGGVGSDPEVYIALHSATVIAVACNTTVWDIEYTSVNGSITRFVTSPSNTSMANIMMGTQRYTQIADPYLTQAFSTAGWDANSAQDMADGFANEYSLAALSLGAGAIYPSASTEAQLRTNKLVARVPLAPLFALLVSNLLLLILGLILTAWAIGAAGGDVNEVQARLGVVGLVGSCFEGEAAQHPVRHVEDIFGEKSDVGARKVGFLKTPFWGWVLGIGGY
jgi:hypothetical protein